ncbi:MAG: DUF3761 domain-containing protein [Alphaproteobacteria bacterium]|nr:MAG: DUF3761 domain-containing protein [Alphaproteobacteria bacterium]
MNMGPALALALAATAMATLANAACGPGYYRDANGHCVPRPVQADRAPAGASARCRDGTFSFSHSRRGSCSRHGGVAVWL